MGELIQDSGDDVPFLFVLEPLEDGTLELFRMIELSRFLEESSIEEMDMRREIPLMRKDTIRIITGRTIQMTFTPKMDNRRAPSITI